MPFLPIWNWLNPVVPNGPVWKWPPKGIWKETNWNNKPRIKFQGCQSWLIKGNPVKMVTREAKGI